MTPVQLARVVATFALSEEQLARLFATWDESKHPRHPEGSDKGGEFAPKNEMSQDEFMGFLRSEGGSLLVTDRNRTAALEAEKQGLVKIEWEDERLGQGQISRQLWRTRGRIQLLPEKEGVYYSEEQRRIIELYRLKRDSSSANKRKAIARLMKAGLSLRVASDALTRAEEFFSLEYAVRRPLYVRRDVVNAAEIIEWAKGAGFETTPAPDDMHVTCCYSKRALNWDKIEPNYEAVRIGDSKGRTVEPLGDEGAVVLKFQSLELQDRFTEFKNAGASWDYPQYEPHITITYRPPARLDPAKVAPYDGPIILGPEIFEEIDEEFAESLDEYAEWDESKHRRYPAGHPLGGKFAPKGEVLPTSYGPDALQELLKSKRLKREATDAPPLTAEDAEVFDQETKALHTAVEKEAKRITGAAGFPDNEAVKSAIAEAIGARLVAESVRMKDAGEEKPTPAEDLAALESKFGPAVGNHGHTFSQSSQLAKFAAVRVSTWASTSGDGLPQAIAMQHAVADEFDLQGQGTRFEHMMKRFGGTEADMWRQAVARSFKNTHGYSPMKPVEVTPEDIARMKRLNQAFVRAQYENTQDFLQRSSVSEVYLHRGVSGGAKSAAGPHFQTFGLQPASSFSTNRAVARRFGSTLLMAKVPASRVLGCNVSGYGCRGEHEFIVLGGRLPAVKSHGSDFGAFKSGVTGGKYDSRTAILNALGKTAGAGVEESTEKKLAREVYETIVDPAVFEADELIENADWTKQTWDLPFAPDSAEARAWLRAQPAAAKLPVVKWNMPQARDYAQLESELNDLEDQAVVSLQSAIEESRDRFLAYVAKSLGPDGPKDRAAWLERLDLKGWGPAQDAFGEMLRQGWEHGRRYARAVAPSIRTLAEWDESKHPRHQKGSAQGGKFAPKKGVDELLSEIDEAAPRTEGIAAAEEAWRGGVADFGDPESAYLIQGMPGYFDYKSVIEEKLRNEFGDEVPVYRAMRQSQLDDWQAGADIGPIATSLDRDVAANWAKFAGHKNIDKDPMIVVSIKAPPEAVVMLGKIEEREIVLDANAISAHTLKRLAIALYATPTSFAPRASLEWLKSKQLYVSGVAKDDLLKRAKGLILQALKTGESEDKTMEKLRAAWEPYVGKKVDPAAMSRLRTIVRTNTTEALNEGIVTEARSPDMRGVVKALVYVAVLDERTTPICEMLHGTQIWPDDPRLDAIVPPNHFNCRSILDPVIDDDEYDPDALLSVAQYQAAVNLVQPGFGGNKAVNLSQLEAFE